LAEATLKVSGGRKLLPPIYCTVQAEALERHQITEASESSDKSRTLVGCGLAVPETKVVIGEPVSRVRCAPGDVGEVWVAVPETKVVIVERVSRMRCAPGDVGEIWVAGPGVARGYWNHPEETEETFHAHLADTLEGPFL